MGSGNRSTISAGSVTVKEAIDDVNQSVSIRIIVFAGDSAATNGRGSSRLIPAENTLFESN